MKYAFALRQVVCKTTERRRRTDNIIVQADGAEQIHVVALYLRRARKSAASDPICYPLSSVLDMSQGKILLLYGNKVAEHRKL